MSVSDPHMQAHAHTDLLVQEPAHPIHTQIRKSKQAEPSLPRHMKQTVAPVLSALNFLSCFPASASLSIQMHVYSTQLAPPTHSALLWFLSFQMFVSWILTDRKHRHLPLKICVRGALVGGKMEIQMTPASHHNTCQCRGAQS